MKVLVTYASHVFITNIRKKYSAEIFARNIRWKYLTQLMRTFHSFKFHIEKANNRLNIHGKLSAC